MPSFLSLIHLEMPKLPSTQTLPDTAITWNFISMTGHISSAKILAYALDKSRLNRLSHEERSFHVFYQFIAGATPEKRDHFHLEDPLDYAPLTSSGCYHLPVGPFSNDSIAMDELHAAMRTLDPDLPTYVQYNIDQRNASKGNMHQLAKQFGQ
ncbi:hypothetical protein PILCRDRAFT_12745 [Piloderma croceum F 1598]|uniref:Myosin motor domain-containing protein n=1 Tax=Piloderma croceum (strain F 1598) TaxID=765440 RepID=A0A0C3ARD5_PILCF|nr:hypothetical protein PILCRDRAFT_12745 [Piloderma croceum F 1598]